MITRIQVAIAAVLACLMFMAAPRHEFEVRVIADAYAEFDDLFERAEARVIAEAKAEFDALFEAASGVTFEVYVQFTDEEISYDPAVIEFVGEFNSLAHAIDFAENYRIANDHLFCVKYAGMVGGMTIMNSKGEFIDDRHYQY